MLILCLFGPNEWLSKANRKKVWNEVKCHVINDFTSKASVTSVLLHCVMLGWVDKIYSFFLLFHLLSYFPHLILFFLNFYFKFLFFFFVFLFLNPDLLPCVTGLHTIFLSIQLGYVRFVSLFSYSLYNEVGWSFWRTVMYTLCYFITSCCWCYSVVYLLEVTNFCYAVYLGIPLRIRFIFFFVFVWY